MAEMFSEHYFIYQKIKYACALFVIIGLGVFGFVNDSILVSFSVLTLILMYFVNNLLAKYDDRIGSKIIVLLRYVELSLYSLFDYLYPDNMMSMSLWTILIIYSGLTFIIESSEFDRSTVFLRKILFFIPIILKILLSISKTAESEWLIYCVLQALLASVIFAMSDAYLHMNDTYESIKRKLTIEKSNIESNNEKLIDYQEKVKSINEQINYQKIDLARTLRELEQVNIEIESQTEIMKYMASTFDVLKCMNVISDSIMDIKKPKLCALFIDKDVYQNKYSSCIIKTNYTSMQRRLKKDIEDIFEDICKKNEESRKIYKNDTLKGFRFIGDANINSLAIFEIKEKKKPYGIMIIGSDDIDFFDKGTTYYENCVMEFVSALKSTKLYLQMEDMARKDGLTGIYNRVYNTDLFKKVAKEAVAKNKPLTVALFDIDKFKNVNDTYGHLAGDDVIKMVAVVAQKYAEKYNGFACRFGGEEFLLTLPDYNENDALEILETMHNEIKNTVVHSQQFEISVNVCIGVSSYPNICENPDILVSRADKAMYYGKKHGRGRLVLDGPDIDMD